MDAFQFIKDVPTDWGDTRILVAEPGDYVLIALKEKNGKTYEATIYEDAENADWLKNPEAYKIRKINVDQASKLILKLAPGGGTAVSIKPL
jgi:hypothetical protein